MLGSLAESRGRIATRYKYQVTANSSDVTQRLHYACRLQNGAGAGALAGCSLGPFLFVATALSRTLASVIGVIGSSIGDALAEPPLAIGPFSLEPRLLLAGKELGDDAGWR